MNILKHLRVWLRQWRRRLASKKQKSVLREFVYLDEVSVYSLIASRLGPIAAEFSETQTTSLQGEIGGSLGGSVGVAANTVKTEIAPSALTTQSRGTQVLRKSIVQTTFKELYELEADALVLRSMSKEQAPPEIRNFEDLEAKADEPSSKGWIVNPESLIRGQMIEMEVQLEAENVFHIRAVVSAILELLEDNPELFGVSGEDDLGQIKSLDRLLEKLLVGLVPIRGQALDYVILKAKGKEWIIHQRILTQLLGIRTLSTYPLYVVGVAEQSLFWKDIRRVLFSRARFQVLCRISEDGLQDSWTPVKLTQVLELVAPNLADQIQAAGSASLSIASRAKASSSNARLHEQLRRRALSTYAILLAKHYDKVLTEEDLSDAGLPSEQQYTSFDSASERRAAFEEMARFVLERFSLERDPRVVADYRAVALDEVGADIFGQPKVGMVLENSASCQECEDVRFLDSEFVAIYW